MPSWVDHALWWHVYPLGFLGAPPQAATAPPEPGPTHRLPRLTAWLDYLVELGASGLALGPIFASASHGYDTIDYFRIDPRLGDENDFQVLVEQAHTRGIRIMLDGVFNHVSHHFSTFEQALREGRASDAAQWFHLYWKNDDSSPDYEHFEGHRDLVCLNHDSDVVVDFIVEVMSYWLARGADAWRLDAAYAVPATFWARVIPRVRERFPDAYFVGEMIHGEYAEYVRASTLDAVTQYELWKAIWSSLNDVNFHELSWTLTRNNEFLDTFVPLTFIGNHDVTRIASKLDDQRHLAHAVVLLMTVGGTPSIYAGDEQGFRGIKEDRPGGDDAVRPAFPEDPADLSPLGRPILDLYRELIALRRRHPWLHHARTRIAHVANDQIVYISEYDDQALTVAMNLADTPAAVPASGTVVAGHVSAAAARQEFLVPAHGWAVLAPPP